MEIPGHFPAEEDYFQDDRYKPSLWLVWEEDKRGRILWKETRVVLYLMVSQKVGKWWNWYFLVGMEISDHIFE